MNACFKAGYYFRENDEVKLVKDFTFSAASLPAIHTDVVDFPQEKVEVPKPKRVRRRAARTTGRNSDYNRGNVIFMDESR